MPMRAPARRARQAAVQPVTDKGAAWVVRRGGQVTPTKDPLSDLRERQALARSYAHTMGPVRSTVFGKAETCARCRLTVEERPEGSAEWTESENSGFAGVFDRFSNQRQTANDLVLAQAYRRSTDGEMFLINQQTPRGVEWSVHAVHLVAIDQPEPGSALVRLIPGGKPSDGTAFVVPKEQALWLLQPDEDAPLYATSPVLSAIDDLRLARTAGRRLEAKIENMLAMDGALWMASEAATVSTDTYDDEGAGEALGATNADIKQFYFDAAQLRYREDIHDIAQLVPTLFMWSHEYGPPQYVQLGEAIDPKLLDVIDRCWRAYARAENVPADLVLGGGAPSDVNHWTGWLTQDQNFKLAIAPLMDRICADITTAFLHPLLTMSGIDPRSYRVGYDPAEVVARPDQFPAAMQLNMRGILSDEATLDAANFNADTDLMTDPTQREWLLNVLSKGQQGSMGPSPLPGSTTQTQSPPPGTNGNAPAPPATSVASILASALAQYAEDDSVRA